MIVDSSVLMAIVMGEPEAERLMDALSGAGSLSVSAPTVVEATVAAESRGGPEAASDIHALLADLEIEVAAFDEQQAGEAITAWRRFGKSRHPAALNFGDTFPYALSRTTGEPLLFKGLDFPQTDVVSAL